MGFFDVVSETDDAVKAAHRLATAIRLRALRMVARRGFGYLGQALSSAEQFAVLYGLVVRQGVDRVVVSPGHYVIAAFAAAAELGILDVAELDIYGDDGSRLEAIGTERSPVVDYTCGSLGQGLSAAAGFALADRLKGRVDTRTYALVSDGELEEGQVWEAALFAAHNRLGHLIVLLDANNSQVDGPVDTITTIEPLAAKWQAFGWSCTEVDGHNVEAVHAAIKTAGSDGDPPTAVVCRTSTRRGLRCLPSDVDGHFMKVSEELAAAATAELEAELASLA